MKIIQTENVKKSYGRGTLVFDFYGTGIDIISIATPEATKNKVSINDYKEDGTTQLKLIQYLIWDSSEIEYGVSINDICIKQEVNNKLLTLEKNKYELQMNTDTAQKTSYIDSIIIYNK